MGILKAEVMIVKHAFLVGAIGYPMLEILWRGRTHYSMALAGGCAASLVNRIRRLPGKLPAKAILCAAAITGVEYACGSVWNRNFDVWDYRRMPLNWRGQICLPYSMMWCFLGAAAMKAFDLADKTQGRT